MAANRKLHGNYNHVVDVRLLAFQFREPFPADETVKCRRQSKHQGAQTHVPPQMSYKPVEAYHDSKCTSVVPPMGVLAKEGGRALRGRLHVAVACLHVTSRYGLGGGGSSPQPLADHINVPSAPRPSETPPNTLLIMGSGAAKPNIP